MARVETAEWGQGLQDLRVASVGSPRRRTRERFQALSLVCPAETEAGKKAETNCGNCRW
jgi:hypothetical protein